MQDNLLSGIKNVILDLGGVLFAVDYHLTAKAFQNLGLLNFETLYSQAKQSHLFDQLETGALSSARFRQFIRDNAHSTLSDEAIDAAWCAMLIGMPQAKFDTLKKLKAHFRLFLLSNTNAIHLPAVRAMIELQTPGQTLEAHFEKCYYSHEVHMRKPNAEIFELVVQQNGLRAKETLFLDDSIQHVEGAKRCKLEALHITDELNTEKLFSQFL